MRSITPILLLATTLGCQPDEPAVQDSGTARRRRGFESRRSLVSPSRS